MKALDEVIKAYELSCGKKDCAQCPYNDECLDHFTCECYERMDDTFHYLKVLQKMQKAQPLEKSEWDELYNQPLTWEELRGMEGKPVWVELPHSYRKAWGLNDGMFTDAYGNDCITVKVLHDLWHLQQKQMGEAWQAYRKERG